MESGNKKFIVQRLKFLFHDDLFKSKFPLQVFWRFDRIFDFGILIRIAIVLELAISCSSLLLQQFSLCIYLQSKNQHNSIIYYNDYADEHTNG
jgi:hypothetical protein